MTIEYYGTQIVGHQKAETVEQRYGRCYELAGYALALGTASRDAILIHGTMHGIRAPRRIEHAWLLIRDGDAVWEPIRGGIWPSLGWDAIARPQITKIYTQHQLRQMIAKFGNWGPWNTGIVVDKPGTVGIDVPGV